MAQARDLAQYLVPRLAMPFRYDSTVELRHLRYFVATAELLNLTKAAARLRVAQPALSRQIRDLEDEIGVRLFERSRRGMKLTEPGVAFLPEARAILQKASEAVESTRAVARGEWGEIHIGYAPSPTVEVLPRVLNAFHQLAPGIRVTLHDLSTQGELDGLRQHRLQAALTVGTDAWAEGGLEFEPLQRYPMCLAVSPKSPLASKKRVTMADAAQLPWLAYGKVEYPEYHEALDSCSTATGIKPEIAEEHDSFTSLLAAIEIGRGVAMLSSSMELLAGGRVKLIPLHPAPPPLVVGVAYDAAQLSLAGRKFIEAARSAAAAEIAKPKRNA
jgi:DNA-binding transcriptional LysR family regulator